MNDTTHIAGLQQRIKELEQENALLRRDFHRLPQGNAVTVPDDLKPVFDKAQQTVGTYFRELKMEPGQGTIEINDQRYVLVRASALSKDFLDTIQKLYADRGTAEALSIGKNFLFDIAHVIGMNDARNFHAKMNLTDPIAKLSAGPVHFAYSGWAFVDILPESHPTPDDDFYLAYRHPYSFEADSWKRSGEKASIPVCIMNSGYSSGWCEESFGIPLTAVEVSCTAKGDEHCTFLMSPPHKIQEHLDRYQAQNNTSYAVRQPYDIPTFFERKKVEEEMQRSRLMAEASAKAKSDFVANVSHELRTPLNAILGFAGLMSRTGLDPVQQEYMEAVSSSGSSLLAIINDILDLSKLDAEKLVPEKVPFSIQELLRAVQLMLKPRAVAQQLDFRCTVDAALPARVLGDPMRLRQILVNLIGNAIKFTREGGVYVQGTLLQQEGSSVSVAFSIKDTGIGIPVAQQETIFERFNQGDNDTTRKYGGTGLGLAIAKQLVQLQDGTLTLKSEPGKGSEFVVVLPFDLEMENPVDMASPKATATIKTQQVLIVEDNLMNQKLARIMLQNNGFNIAIANNGIEALELLREQRFDLILMDIQMPLMDGCQAARAIRRELHLDIPIIAMTAYALDSEREQCIREGMNDYLAKPFQEKDLLLKIAKWLPVEEHKNNTPVQPLISFAFLKEQTGNNMVFIEEMIGLFLEHNPENIRDLDRAIRQADFDVIRKITHILRNETAFFGLQPVVGDKLQDMEQLAGAGENIKVIAGLFEMVKAVCGEAVKELHQAIKDKTYRDA